MATTVPQPTIKVIDGAAAAIVTARMLEDDDVLALVAQDQKFVVHPFVSAVADGEEPLGRYLRSIYRGKSPEATEYPGSPAFSQLVERDGCAAGVREMAEALAKSMSRRRAAAGILFGFTITVDGQPAHGVIKADLDEEDRFHMEAVEGDRWSLKVVDQVLPAPRGDFAKYAISPQPNGTAPAGVRDKSSSGAAADYFLRTIGASIPLTTGGKSKVARAAVDVGLSIDEVNQRFKGLEEEEEVASFVPRVFPEIQPDVVQRLQGSETRPLRTVRRDDSFIRIYETTNPHFRLEVDESVQVVLNGRTVTVTLPEDSEDIRPRPK